MNNKISILFFVLAAFFLGSCEPQELDKPEIGGVPAAEDISFSVNLISGDDFHFELVNTSTVTGIASWDLGNGTSLTGDKVTAYYPLAGTYDITLTLLTKGGQNSSSLAHVQDKTDYSIFTDPLYVNISGGTAAANGKTWVVDSLYKGHFGIGPVDGASPDWWSADPVSKPGSGSYDDEFTFNITGFTFDFMNNGSSYAKDFQAGVSAYSVLGNPNGEADILVGFTTEPGTWSLTERDGVNYLTLIGDSPLFFGFDYGAQNNEYRIESVTENELRLSCIGADGNRWFNILIPKGYERPVEEPDPKELMALDITDDFEGNGNISWLSDTEAFETIDNFAPVGANTSAHIQKYSKASYEWSNVSLTLDYILDLSTRNKFKMKVFMPAFNDYVTACNPGTDWLTTHNLQPIIEVKLHNSELGGNAYTTQVTQAHTLTEDQLGQWVELEFDFSSAAARTDFDKIVIQFGAEGHCNAGIFYMDDFELLP